MSAYAERRKGKLTGKWIGEAVLGGDRFRKRFETKKDAERWADFVKLTGAPPPEADAPQGITFGEVLRDMKQTTGAVRDHSAGQRLEYVAERIGPLTPIADVTTTMLDRLVTTLKKRPGKKGEPMAPATVNRYLSAASAVLTFAKARGHLTATPVIPWMREAGRRFHWLTEAQEARVLEHMEAAGQQGSALIVRVLVASGMRWGEFESLEAAQVEVRNENAWVRLWKTKTDSPRSIPIPVALGRQLLAALEAGSLPGYQAFRTHLKASLESAGQSPDFCIHSLRHTTCTRLIQRGVNLAVVQKFLGHKSIETTLKYAQLSDDDLANAAGKISQHAGHLAEVA